MQGNAYRLAGALGPLLAGYDPDLEPYPYDPDRARELLAEAGYADGFDVVLTSPNGRYLNDRLASEAIAGMWTEVGVRTTVEVMDWSPFVEGVIGSGPAGKSLDAFFFQQLGFPLDAGVSTNFHAAREGAAWQGYSNDEVSQIIDEAVTVLDPAERNELYKRMGQILYEECPWVFLWNTEGLTGVREEVQGWEPHPDGVLHLLDVHLVEA
jgi:peptide/nickel transport system substrate-binding protein